VCGYAGCSGDGDIDGYVYCYVGEYADIGCNAGYDAYGEDDGDVDRDADGDGDDDDGDGGDADYDDE